MELGDCDSISEQGKEDLSFEVALLTPPLSFDGAPNSHGQGQKQHNLLSGILKLFKSISLGSDLSKFQLPPQFNFPKSQLQLFGESVFCSSVDLLSNCVEARSELERFKAVVAWSISTVRPPIFGKAPYNPILGETHHVSSGNLNLLLEQVSHHPPVTALHASNEVQNIEMTWWQQPLPRFHGGSVETTISGKRILKLLAFDEKYEMNCPKLSIRFFPNPCMEWVGPVAIHCRETGLEAMLYYTVKSLFGLKRDSTRLTGKIFKTSTAQELYEVEGHWDQTVTLREVESSDTRLLYDANVIITNLKTPIVKNARGLAATESAIVWSGVSDRILKKDWIGAKEAKKMVEEKQRILSKERESEGRPWRPRFFRKIEEGGWEWLHHGRPVPSAPIVIP